MPAKLERPRGELISATSGLLLLVTMFALAWYGVDGIPGRTPRLVYAESAWHGLTVVRWVMLATSVAAVGSVPLHYSQRSHGVRTETGLLVTLLGTLTAALLIYRVLIALPSSDRVVDQKLGAFLGVLWALGIAYGGLESLREERSRRRASPPGRRGHEPPGSPPPAPVGSVKQGGDDKDRISQPTTGTQIGRAK
jgi:hypothetical protein